ncbi:dihydrofolate reductase family protein [Georgenia phoenicis]|uniref:dihydrofolate reductase family protein n=1 Tax=unclassified Georgenia TaxID=2626815 RepID=UPI0039B08310
MRRPITAELFVSLDLVVAEPQTWHLPWVDEAMLSEVAREQDTSTVLLGRRTYDVFASSWPGRGDDVPLAAQLNAMTKVVVSDRITDAEASWAPTTVLRPGGDLTAAVASLDELGDDRVTVAGSVSLVEQLLALGLLTELRLVVHPLVLGTGRRLFDGWAAGGVELTLAGSTPLGRGARLDVYQPITIAA